MIVGRLIPAGTGLAYHNQRRKNASGLTEAEMATLAGEAGRDVESGEAVSRVPPGPDRAGLGGTGGTRRRVYCARCFDGLAPSRSPNEAQGAPRVGPRTAGSQMDRGWPHHGRTGFRYGLV